MQVPSRCLIRSVFFKLLLTWSNLHRHWMSLRAWSIWHWHWLVRKEVVYNIWQTQCHLANGRRPLTPSPQIPYSRECYTRLTFKDASILCRSLGPVPMWTCGWCLWLRFYILATKSSPHHFFRQLLARGWLFKQHMISSCRTIIPTVQCVVCNSLIPKVSNQIST